MRTTSTKVPPTMMTTTTPMKRKQVVVVLSVAVLLAAGSLILHVSLITTKYNYNSILLRMFNGTTALQNWTQSPPPSWTTSQSSPPFAFGDSESNININSHMNNNQSLQSIATNFNLLPKTKGRNETSQFLNNSHRIDKDKKTPPLGVVVDKPLVLAAANQSLEGPVSSTTQTIPFPTISIFVPLSLAMGNYLSGLARGIALQLWARHEYGIETNILFYVRGYHGEPPAIQQCFPKLRKFGPYHHGIRMNHRIFYIPYLQRQQEWLSGIGSQDLYQALLVKSARAGHVDHALSSLRDFLLNNSASFIVHTTTDDVNYTISLPFLTITGDYGIADLFVDKYYHEFRDIFQFDYDACCNLKPADDESVFHFRNFQREVGPLAIAKGFHELDENRTTDELFGHLQPGDKVAITSRYPTDASVQVRVSAMERRGLKVRVITNQSGTEDFCFLMHAKKELVGMAESSFSLWAGYLGNATKVRLYSMDTPGRRSGRSMFKHRVFVHYNWTNSQLQRKVHFELYKQDKFP